MADFGGEMQFNVPGLAGVPGGVLRLRGTFSTGPSGLEVQAITNQDNTTSRAFRPNGFKCQIKALESADGVDWSAVMRAPRQAMNIVEQATGRIHVFGNAFFSGEPQVDADTGEVTGLVIAADRYKLTNG